MVTVYTTQTCAFCAMVKKYFTLKGVEFEAVDVTEDEAKRKELQELTGLNSVPVTVLGDQFVVGFNAGKLAELVA